MDPCLRFLSINNPCRQKPLSQARTSDRQPRLCHRDPAIGRCRLSKQKLPRMGDFVVSVKRLQAGCHYLSDLLSPWGRSITPITSWQLSRCSQSRTFLWTMPCGFSYPSKAQEMQCCKALVFALVPAKICPLRWTTFDIKRICSVYFGGLTLLSAHLTPPNSKWTKHANETCPVYRLTTAIPLPEVTGPYQSLNSTFASSSEDCSSQETLLI